MKALGVRQPWAWVIIRAGKDIENRTWVTNYLGALAIHAGKTCTVGDWEDGVWLIKQLAGKNPPPQESPRLGRGAVIGIVELVDRTPAAHADGWGGQNPSVFHWHLRNPRPCKPAVVRGSLGLFEVKL